MGDAEPEEEEDAREADPTRTYYNVKVAMKDYRAHIHEKKS